MDDAEVLQRIHDLVDEEHDLEHRHVGAEATAAEVERLARLEVQLDQCWDLLRQRRARRRAGQDPDDATPRSGDTVEHYRQ
jgi:hypothetical protein